MKETKNVSIYEGIGFLPNEARDEGMVVFDPEDEMNTLFLDCEIVRKEQLETQIND